MATKTIDDIQPKAVMSPNEQGRWGSLPPDEQLVLGSVPHAVRYSFPLLSKLLILLGAEVPLRGAKILLFINNLASG